jgi:hypothetical protein
LFVAGGGNMPKLAFQVCGSVFYPLCKISCLTRFDSLCASAKPLYTKYRNNAKLTTLKNAFAAAKIRFHLRRVFSVAYARGEVNAFCIFHPNRVQIINSKLILSETQIK